jgi:hypothetical protein
MGDAEFHHDAGVASRLRRLESEFLKPHRFAIAVGAVGLLLQSLLLLPVPLLQGWVLDRLVALVRKPGPGGPAEAAATRAIALGFLATIACHLVRMALNWGVAAMMGRISQ